MDASEKKSQMHYVQKSTCFEVIVKSTYMPGHAGVKNYPCTVWQHIFAKLPVNNSLSNTFTEGKSFLF